MTQDPKNLIKARQQTHGDAWKHTGMALMPILPQVFAFMQKHPKYVFSWVLIFNKLLRALVDPTVLDHWKDIQGYAQLIIDDLETK
jgi:hypothetical protein